MKNSLSLLAACLLVAGTSQTAFAQAAKKSAKVGDGVYELVYNDKDNQVYVATTRGNSGKPVIYALDASTMDVKDSIVLETGAFGLGINRKTQILYGTATRAGAVIAVDIKTKKTVARITNGQEKGHTREVVVNQKTNKVYVSDVSGGVWVIDGKTNTFSHMLKGIKGAVTSIRL
jgi:DNA-binding beta-propeller fold protein YncE